MMAFGVSVEMMEFKTHGIQATLKLPDERSLNIFSTFNIEAIKLR